jgi:hypothetical protein
VLRIVNGITVGFNSQNDLYGTKSVPCKKKISVAVFGIFTLMVSADTASKSALFLKQAGFICSAQARFMKRKNKKMERIVLFMYITYN